MPYLPIYPTLATSLITPPPPPPPPIGPTSITALPKPNHGAKHD